MPRLKQQPGWNNRPGDGQRRLLVKRALFTATGAAPDTPEVHLHLNPLLPLPRGLFRQVNAHSLSKSCPNRRSRFIPNLGYMTPRARFTLHAFVFPSPNNDIYIIHICKYIRILYMYGSSTHSAVDLALRTVHYVQKHWRIKLFIFQDRKRLRRTVCRINHVL